MKKKIGLLVLSLASLSFINKVNAASVSVSASSNYITNGNKVTFYIKIDDAVAISLIKNYSVDDCLKFKNILENNLN